MKEDPNPVVVSVVAIGIMVIMIVCLFSNKFGWF